MPFDVMKDLYNVYDDLALRRQIDKNNLVKTFCLANGGSQRIFHNDGVTSIDGAKLGRVFSPKAWYNYGTNHTNIAINHRSTDTWADLDKLLADAAQCNIGNMPIVQDMGSFLSGNGCVIIDEPKMRKELGAPYVPADLATRLPKKTLQYIRMMIDDLDAMFPGFANPNNLVSAPTVEGVDNYELTQDMTTSIADVYMGGDAVSSAEKGSVKGVAPAMITGFIIGENINKKRGYGFHQKES